MSKKIESADVMSVASPKKGKGCKFLKFVAFCAIAGVAVKKGKEYLDKKQQANDEKNKDSRDKSYITVLGAKEISMSGKEIHNFDLAASLAAQSLDLSKAVIKEDIVINCKGLMCAFDITVPANVNVETNVKNIASGVCNEAEYHEGAPTVFFTGSLIMAALNIKVGKPACVADDIVEPVEEA